MLDAHLINSNFDRFSRKQQHVAWFVLVMPVNPLY